MQKSSQLVISLLLANGAEAISLNNKVTETISLDEMTDPKYLSEMTLENWKLFT